MHYQFYREHKYVSHALNDVERLIAKTDFRDETQTRGALEAFRTLADMLRGHAQYENERLHALLEKKQSTLHIHAEEDHVSQEKELIDIESLLQGILKAKEDEERLILGYQLYLTYRKFVADELLHLHEEETVLLPELQRLYSDEELRQVEAETYRIMTVDEIQEMIDHLFPHMNPSDHAAFLADIEEARA